MGEPKHVGLHDCTHECSRLWCRLSRKEAMEPITDTMTIDARKEADRGE